MGCFFCILQCLKHYIAVEFQRLKIAELQFRCAACPSLNRLTRARKDGAGVWEKFYTFEFSSTIRKEKRFLLHRWLSTVQQQQQGDLTLSACGGGKGLVDSTCQPPAAALIRSNAPAVFFFFWMKGGGGVGDEACHL